MRTWVVPWVNSEVRAVSTPHRETLNQSPFSVVIKIPLNEHVSGNINY